MTSNLTTFANFLAQLGRRKKLFDRKGMRKAIEKAGLTEEEVELLREGDALKIEAYMVQSKGRPKPLPNQGPGD